MTEEEWRPLPGYEGLYWVSDLGQIKSSKRPGTAGGVVKPILKAPGYYCVRVGKNAGARIHRLVTLAFLGPCPEGMEVRHLNGDRSDNRLANLAYGTRSENAFDNVTHGGNPMANKTHCKRGHEFIPENMYTFPSAKARICRICTVTQRRERRARQRAARADA